MDGEGVVGSGEGTVCRSATSDRDISSRYYSTARSPLEASFTVC